MKCKMGSRQINLTKRGILYALLPMTEDSMTDKFFSFPHFKRRLAIIEEL